MSSIYSSTKSTNSSKICTRSFKTWCCYNTTSINTNRINIPVESVTNNLSESISFNANLFKEVLSANRECTSAVLEVSNEGLARVNFKVDDYDTTYYIVAMKEVD